MISETVKEELRDKGIKNTRAKGVLLEILKKVHKPMDVNSLHKESQKVTPVNLVTVYRTLEQFQQKGIVQEFLGKESTKLYEYINKNTKAHPHFSCEKCGTLFCLGALEFDDALYFSNMAKKHKVLSINITLSGICESCLS
ncbi:MAG: transcriptional repressor [Campylobacterales bacterium]|nr:transcriptional repressor [Campylobacterales bacterium]